MDQWLPSFITKKFELAIKLARKGVAYIQTSAVIRERLRNQYANHPDSLTHASEVKVIHYQTVAAANNYWR